MFIRKSKIASLIKKERGKERLMCKKENDKNIKIIKSEIETKYNLIIKDLKNKYENIIQEQKNQIRILSNEIEKNHNLYTSVRLREKSLYDLFLETESELTKMVTKVHESMQPFYRAMSKIEITKKKSDKKHNKYDKLLSVVK